MSLCSKSGVIGFCAVVGTAAVAAFAILPERADAQPRAFAGVCCLTIGCDDTLTETECTDAGGEWRTDESCASIVCNDLCETALFVDGDLEAGVSYSFDTPDSREDGHGEAAGFCVNDFIPGIGLGSRAQWFAVTPECDGLLDVITTGTNTELSVWDDCPNAGGVIVGCAADEGLGFEAELTDFAVTAGTTYLVRISTLDPSDTFTVGTEFLLHDTSNCPVDCPGDANGDSVVNIRDVIAVLRNLGSDGSNGGDLNGDGFVGLIDLIIVIMNLGTSC